MAFRRPDEATRSGTMVFYGWLVAQRPRLMQLARFLPGITTFLLMGRAALMVLPSLPATTLTAVIAVAATGEWFPHTFMVLGWVWAVVSWIGPRWLLPALIGLRIGTWILFAEVRKRAGVAAEIPWGIISVASIWAFVLWPILTSPYGPFILAVWVVEGLAGAFLVPVRKWRLAWSFRRRWPMVWTIIDNTTADPQASFAGGISAFFSQARSIPRPVFNHPALSPWMDFSQYGAVTFWMHAPNGTVLHQIEKKTATIAEQYDYVTSIEWDHKYDGNSWARMTVRFIEVDAILGGIEREIAAEMADHDLAA